MKKKITVPDYIGGQGPLTREEEAALASYFASKKEKGSRLKKKSTSKLRSRKKATA